MSIHSFQYTHLSRFSGVAHQKSWPRIIGVTSSYGFGLSLRQCVFLLSRRPRCVYVCGGGGGGGNVCITCPTRMAYIIASWMDAASQTHDLHHLQLRICGRYETGGGRCFGGWARYVFKCPYSGRFESQLFRERIFWPCVFVYMWFFLLFANQTKRTFNFSSIKNPVCICVCACIRLCELIHTTLRIICLCICWVNKNMRAPELGGSRRGSSKSTKLSWTQNKKRRPNIWFWNDSYVRRAICGVAGRDFGMFFRLSA